MSDIEIPKSLSAVGGWVDDRFHAAAYLRRLTRKVFPDHWSFLLGEIALWSFVILICRSRCTRSPGSRGCS